MKIPISWLKEFIEIKKTPQNIADDLTSLGFETEAMGSVLEIEITPNRGDCLSVLGIAKELAAIYNLKIKLNKPKINFTKTNLPFKIEFKQGEICSRYSYSIIDYIKICPSPKFVQKKLIACGFRPINNIVDITNFVMLELGQPLHAFDYHKIVGQKMIIRRGKKGEKVVTLDGAERLVNEDSIIIQDNKKLVDLAGIMGGQNSEVDLKTKTIVLQAAIFDPILIRRTIKKLGILTDASYRYERKVDFKGTIFALERAINLISKTCKARTYEIMDIINIKQKAKKISWNPKEDVKRILNISLSKNEIFNYLKRLNFEEEKDSVIIPSYRYDIKFPEDLVEEVARLYGYQKLPAENLDKKIFVKSCYWEIKEKIKDFLVSRECVEVKSYPYLSLNDLKKIQIFPGKCLEISNPLSEENRYLRPLLLPSMLKLIAKNPWFSDISMFEIGKVFNKENETENIIIAKTSTQFPEKIKKLNPRRVSQDILDRFKIRKKVYFIELPLSKFKNFVSLSDNLKVDFPKINYQKVSFYPPVVFDLSILAKENISNGDIIGTIKSSSDRVFLVELFDEYQSKSLPSGTKSLAYHIVLSSNNHTLIDDEIKNVRRQIIEALNDKLKVKLRA